VVFYHPLSVFYYFVQESACQQDLALALGEAALERDLLG
jgi:hypothetical protein